MKILLVKQLDFFKRAAIILLFCIFAMIQMQSIALGVVSEKEGDKVANGGSGDEVELIVAQKDIEDIAGKIQRFFFENPEIQKEFPDVKMDDLNNAIEELTVVITEEILIDKHGKERTCLNFPMSENFEIQCNLQAWQELVDKNAVQFVLVFHELLGLMEVEESLSGSEQVIESYPVSGKLAKYVSRVQSYELVLKTKKMLGSYRIGVYKDYNHFGAYDVFNSHSCEIRSLDFTTYGISEYGISEYDGVAEHVLSEKFLQEDYQKIKEELKYKGYKFDEQLLRNSLYGYKNRRLENGIDIEIDSQGFDGSGNKISRFRRTIVVSFYAGMFDGLEFSYPIYYKRNQRPFYYNRPYKKNKMLNWIIKNIPTCRKVSSKGLVRIPR